MNENIALKEASISHLLRSDTTTMEKISKKKISISFKIVYYGKSSIFSKTGGLTGPQLWEGVAGKEEGNFFQGGLQFLQKNKVKSEIFNGEKCL